MPKESCRTDLARDAKSQSVSSTTRHATPADSLAPGRALLPKALLSLTRESDP